MKQQILLIFALMSCAPMFASDESSSKEPIGMDNLLEMIRNYQDSSSSSSGVDSNNRKRAHSEDDVELLNALNAEIVHSQAFVGSSIRTLTVEEQEALELQHKTQRAKEDELRQFFVDKSNGVKRPRRGTPNSADGFQD